MLHCGRKLASDFLTVLLCQILIVVPLAAQQTPAQSAIRIIIVEGMAAKNLLDQIPPRPLIVRVEDTERRPIFNVPVVFEAPSEGPSGDFANDSNTITVFTDPGGTAVAGAFHPNRLAGAYHIKVRVEVDGQYASASISQTNVEKRNLHIKLLAMIGAAGAAGAVAAYSIRNNSAAKPATITFGGSAVGAPKQ